MQKYFYISIIVFTFTSCYTYQRKAQVVVTPENIQNTKMKAVDDNILLEKANKTTAETQINNPLQKVDEKNLVPINIQNELQPTKNYKVKADGKTYKLIVDKWEGDSLVAHSVNRPNKIIKLHKNKIEAEDIAEKRFSKPIADIITILAYTGIGVGVWMLLR